MVLDIMTLAKPPTYTVVVNGECNHPENLAVD